MSSNLSAEIWVGCWESELEWDEDELGGVSNFCDVIGVDYCIQYDSQGMYFVGINIAEASDWGNLKLDFDELTELEKEAMIKLKDIPEFDDVELETQLLPIYF